MAAFSRRAMIKAGAAWALAPAVLAPTALGQSRPAEAKKDPYADGILVDGRPPKPAPGAFTIAVLPDTQHYSARFPETYRAQTNWIVEHRESHNIACVLHLGDIVNQNRPWQWENAVKAMTLLDGKVPYFMVPGNHDYGTKANFDDRTTGLSEHFPVARFRGLPTFGGTYHKEADHLENNFHLFSVKGREFLVLGLEYAPRKEVVRWANEVVSGYKKREVILVTHAYLYFDDTRYDFRKYGAAQSWSPHSTLVAKATQDDVMDGEELWRELVSRHENFIMTINGHVLQDGLGRLTSVTPGGRSVQQILVNFQMRPRGGDGWLRLMEFGADGRTVQIRDYSPTRGQLNESDQNRFSLTLSKVMA